MYILKKEHGKLNLKSFHHIKDDEFEITFSSKSFLVFPNIKDAYEFRKYMLNKLKNNKSKKYNSLKNIKVEIYQ